jgi:3-isopropylmalate/(R)-2-methylmalate dehydratase small subunit
MDAFIRHTGIAVPLDRANVDTDAIIPKQFLKRIERSGFGAFLFYEWRFREDGTVISDFVLNQEPFKGASILIARDNFGCGSSREHAPWALQDYGFRVIIAPSFADIFYSNCFKNGMLPVVLPAEAVDDLMTLAADEPGTKLTADLEQCTLTTEAGRVFTFSLDAYRKHLLLNGLDDIGITLLLEGKITDFETDMQKI